MHATEDEDPFRAAKVLAAMVALILVLTLIWYAAMFGQKATNAVRPTAARTAVAAPTLIPTEPFGNNS